MYQVIARKYRPQSFVELIGQEHVRTTLENAIAQNRIAHGYIFSGQRGIGKTTVARILARCLNCVEGPTKTPCGVCASCIEIAAGNAVDVIEIDAASNRGINEMRELRENVRYRPSRSRYKIFIIDEAHQITNEAFNALLKTLEEPPEWVVFILCTTESHKIPATIASRCQHFSFRSLEFSDIVARMEYICRQEGIQADAEVLGVLAQAGEGSVRDSLSALDQAIACCGSELNAGEVRALLGAFSIDSLAQVTEALRSNDRAAMLTLVAEMERNGYNLQHFCRELARYFRNLLVVKIAGPDTKLVSTSPGERQKLAEIANAFSEEDLARYLRLTLDLYGELQHALQPRLHMEIGLLRLVYASRLIPIEEALSMIGGGSTSLSESEAAPGKKLAPATSPALTAWAEKLAGALRALGLQYTADAVEHSRITEVGEELHFETPKDFRLSMKAPDLQKALEHLGASTLKIRITFTEKPAPEKAAPTLQPNELTERALSHPEVKRFLETFGGQVRQVRDLRE